MSEFEKELDGILEIIKDEKFYDSKLYALPSIEELKAHFKYWQPSKPLVEVPRIVADYIETQKHNNYNGNASLIVKHYDSFKDEGNDSELNIWIANNFNDFLNAIVNGYTVKKEQLYEIRLPIPDSDIENAYALIDIRGNIWEDAFPNKYKLTEQEIKAIDSRYMVFAVKVEG